MQWIPEPLQAIGPAGLTYWQWIGIAIALILAVIGGRVGAVVVQWLARRFTKRTATRFDDELVVRLTGPLRLLGGVAVLRVTLPVLDLPSSPSQIGIDALLALLAMAVVWGVLRAIDLASGYMASAEWARHRPSSRALLLLLSRAAKVVVVVIAMISFLGALGLPVSSLLAGLGIGGIALAFGAQKTVENLFGALALGIDQPLREGDFVRIDADVIGTVESVGLRSTRIRTPDRTVVTLPNGRLADMKIETFAARDRVRLQMMIGLVYSTTADQLRTVIAGFERVLREQPKIWPSDIVVRFLAFGQSSLDIEIVAWFATSDYNEFRAGREAALLGFMDVVEKAGSSFAFPSRTVYLAGRSEGDVRPPPGGSSS